ncbi:MAG TPA: DinB family protein [Candidatus Baltobacteraceae bacterium]|nr:DinB family protein [Candidatus Baltobacteraceae bacterium]
MNRSGISIPEPWLRGTLTEVPAVGRGILHALELALEDAQKWCGDLSDAQIHARPAGLPSIAFQLRHIAGSLDRLLTYADGRALSEEQLQALKAEANSQGTAKELLAELEAAISRGSVRVRALASEDPSLPRAVGSKRLPTTLGGLLVHIADHTQRHVGQAITTAKLVSASKAL